VETFVTVAAILGMIVVGVLLIRLLNSQHGDRMAAIHYGHTGMPVAGPVPRKARGRRRERHRSPSR
jgi:L-asparagine transporter-like permease